MAIKDFSILLEKVDTGKTKKDISMVTGFNAISQYIENVMKTQKGELVSNINLGSNYFNYIFGVNDPGSLELNIASYIQSAIPKINNVSASLISNTQSKLEFKINFSISDGIILQKNASCFIEIDTQ
jgi:phage baseplate assembly protein W